MRAVLVVVIAGLVTGLALAEESGLVQRVEAALDNIEAVSRPGKTGYATVWDGNLFVQCSIAKTTTVCEAAGTRMQPSLSHAIDVQRLLELGWVSEDTFGNYRRVFGAAHATGGIADELVQLLVEGYGANPSTTEVETRWVADVACPPRNGATQNLAGMINDGPAAVPICDYPAPETVSARSLGPTIESEIQRLRLNAQEPIFVVFDAGIGYVQCAPEPGMGAIYCEAQSAESWPALAAILTPGAIKVLSKAGYENPGRSPNYWRHYPLDLTDAEIAWEVAEILRSVYRFDGAWPLEVHTE
jgi:hypothetical protein